MYFLSCSSDSQPVEWIFDDFFVVDVDDVYVVDAVDDDVDRSLIF